VAKVLKSHLFDEISSQVKKRSAQKEEKLKT